MAKNFFPSLPAIKDTVKRGLPRASLGALLAAGTVATGAPVLAEQMPVQDRPVAAQAQAAQQGVAKVTASELIRVAEQEVGVSEDASGGGTPYHAWYMSSQRAKETVARDGGDISAYANAPWCDMFVSWVGEKTGMRATVGWDAYTVTHAKWFKDNGRWGEEPRPGAVVFFAWGGGDSIDEIDHVGLVKSDNGDGTITTIEGNTGNGKVEKRVRPVSEVVGYGYPEYAS
ncbi:CHAP domain-containing protein [Thermostaphylospora chromogena]|uniref:CHAP domain-containing protein n=1 Tax=Thermostaphylospora chromogena TaxID=35622 RepID=A0A1H1C159_9ACTN|nr:CHAP domain-containing protein [Thermostaphylospora chromogena]SDQ57895.1 CHAP domain-containing protein [Thermostaphylospora chromogena]